MLVLTHLFESWQHSAAVPVVHIDGTLVVVLQRRTHYHVVVAVVVEVGNRQQGVAKTGILRLRVGVEGPVQREERLGERKIRPA